MASWRDGEYVSPMRAILALLVLTLLLPLTPRQALAQRGLQVGAAVRVVGLDVPNGMVEGLYAGMQGDSVLIGVQGGIEAVRIPRRAITHLYVRFGRRSGAMRTSMAGMWIGLGAGGAVAIQLRDRLRPSEAPGVVLGGAALGAIAGGAAGQFIFKADRWVETPLDMLDDGR